MNQAATSLTAAKTQAFPQQASLLGACRLGPMALLLAALMCEATAQDEPVQAYGQDQTLASANAAAAESLQRLFNDAAAQRGERPASTGERAQATEANPGPTSGQSRIHLWMSHGRPSLVQGIASPSLSRPAPDGASDARHSFAGALSSDVDLGHTRGTAKVGVEWKLAKSKFGVEKGAAGLRFDSGYRLALKLRRGGFGLFVRGQF